MERVTQDDILRRLRSIKGHVRGVTRMLENDEDLPAVLRQIVALQGALEKIRLILLRGHLANCISLMLNGDDRVELERAFAELEEFLKDAGSK